MDIVVDHVIGPYCLICEVRIRELYGRRAVSGVEARQIGHFDLLSELLQVNLCGRFIVHCARTSWTFSIYKPDGILSGDSVKVF